MKLEQLSGKKNELSKKLTGKERVISRKDTKELFRLSKLANDENGLKNLGKTIYKIIKTQNETPPELV